VAGEKILIVDLDAELSGTLADQVLSPNGFKPLLARGQEEGVSIAMAEGPHLLLLHLPLDSSTRLLDRLQQAGYRIPTILMIEQGPASIDVALLRSGVLDCVIHPFAAEEVLQAVLRVFGQEARSPDHKHLVEDVSTFNRELEQRVKELGTLLGIGRSVNALLDLDAVLNRVTEAAVFVTGAEEGYLLLLDEESGELKLRAAQNLGEKQAQGFSLRVEDSIAGMVIQSGKPMLLGGGGAQNVKVKTGYLVKALLNVPLKVNGRVIGVLGVDNQVSGTHFTLTHLRRLSDLAETVAAAVENARQYAMLQSKFTRRVREVATLQAVTDQLNAVTDFEVGAQLALSLILKATRAEVGVLVWAMGGRECPPFCVSQGSLGDLVVTRRGGGTPERWWDEQTLQRVMETGKPLLEGDLRPEGNGAHSHARSQLAVPMRRGKRVVGALNLESSSPSAFTQDDLQFVLNVADQVAVALEGTALQERAESERDRLSLLMEAVDNAVWVVDTDLRLTAQNEIAGEMLGWSLAEAIGRSVCELASNHSSGNGLCQLLNQAIEERRPISFPHQESVDGGGILLETRDGRFVPVRGRGVPLIRDSRVIGAICAFREVLSKRNDEHVRFEFANMASHLLRSPLSFIQASIDLMLNSELDVEEQRAMLSKMWEQSQRIREFIKELLEMSRLESGVVHVYSEPVVLPRLIERVLDLVRPEEPNYAFNFEAPGAFPVVAADPGKTELVLLGLLRSGMSRCPRGGCITVELETRASEVAVFVTDDGEPVPPRQLERIFTQFYPVDDDGDKMPSTYQLGLYTTKRLIELQTGRVWAESQPGKGTRFGFSLPIWG